MTFRFRAAAALELQRKREDEARLALARAESAVDAASARQAAAERALAIDGQTLLGVERGGAPAWLLAWHRSWMARRRLERDACGRDVDAARETASHAAAAVRDAHRRRRTLERLRDRAWRRYQLENERHDTRQINELAGLRFVARRTAEQGEHDGEHDQHRSAERPDQQHRQH